jgi:hypothetical protein
MGILWKNSKTLENPAVLIREERQIGKKSNAMTGKACPIILCAFAYLRETNHLAVMKLCGRIIDEKNFQARRPQDLNPNPPKLLREKLTPKNLVFLEKNGHRFSPIYKNRKNKRKTSWGVREKLVNRLKTGPFYSKSGNFIFEVRKMKNAMEGKARPATKKPKTRSNVEIEIGAKNDVFPPKYKPVPIPLTDDRRSRGRFYSGCFSANHFGRRNFSCRPLRPSPRPCRALGATGAASPNRSCRVRA